MIQRGSISLLLVLPLLAVGAFLLISCEEVFGGLRVARARTIGRAPISLTAAATPISQGICQYTQFFQPLDDNSFACTYSFAPPLHVLLSGEIIQQELPPKERVLLPLDDDIVWKACLHTVGSYTQTPQGLALSEQSLTSRHLCTESSRYTHPHHGYSGNLALEHHSQPKGLRAILVRGFSELGVLEVNEPLVVFAAGDIFIAQLNSTKTTDVLLYSATGRVVVGKSNPDLRVRVVSFTKISVGAKGSIPASSLLPYQTRFIIREVN